MVLNRDIRFINNHVYHISCRLTLSLANYVVYLFIYIFLPILTFFKHYMWPQDDEYLALISCDRTYQVTDNEFENIFGCLAANSFVSTITRLKGSKQCLIVTKSHSTIRRASVCRLYSASRESC